MLWNKDHTRSTALVLLQPASLHSVVFARSSRTAAEPQPAHFQCCSASRCTRDEAASYKSPFQPDGHLDRYCLGVVGIGMLRAFFLGSVVSEFGFSLASPRFVDLCSRLGLAPHLLPVPHKLCSPAPCPCQHFILLGF